jgi:hypothetical protein
MERGAWSAARRADGIVNKDIAQIKIDLSNMKSPELVSNVQKSFVCEQDTLSHCRVDAMRAAWRAGLATWQRPRALGTGLLAPRFASHAV